MSELPYQLLEQIASTGGSQLYRARRVEDGLPVLIKLGESAAAAQLRQEYELLRSLALPGVAKPLELLEEHPRPAIVLEDFGGESLDTVLTRVSQIDWPTGLLVARNLAQVLAGLHAKQLIHQDVRPANILLELTTGQVCLIDCARARELQPRTTDRDPAEPGAGDWAYISPEQTGRTSHPVEVQSDLYSLGVTLYRMLTGRLPLQAADPIEWAHCHLARTPPPPHTVAVTIPVPVSDILMRLLAKAPQERYQSSHGLIADIDRCLTQWRSSNQIASFPLGQDDFSDQFQIPLKFYGREMESGRLREVLERMAASGRPELVAVSGYSGVGKSSLVHQLRKPVAGQHGYFIAGKFDQYQRNIPYATLTQAFQDLIRQLLAANENRIAQWRQDIQSAVGVNGQILVEVLPQIELIIGPQPAVPALPPSEQQNRFRLVFQRLTAVCCRKEHPLVVFLDDVQWIDPASLTLIEYLVTHPDTRYLLLIVAYRDNEVSPAHPLPATLAAIRNSSVPITDLQVPPLSLTDLNCLVAEALHTAPSSCEPLTRLIFQRTAGNPFFFVQFLGCLYQEGLLRRTASSRGWTWDVAHIETRDFADNAVDLVVGKLRRLPWQTQRALQLAACLGHTFDWTCLALAGGNSERQVQEQLTLAIRAGLIACTGGSGTFLHDRIQQAAYALIPEAQRPAAHLQIGRALCTNPAPEWIEDRIFEIVTQLNRGAGLLSSSEERARVAELNLRAGRRARQSMAYSAALNYLAVAEALSSTCRERPYRLAFELGLLRAECEFLTGAFELADAGLSKLERCAQNLLDRAAIACLRIEIYIAGEQSDRAIQVCLDYLHGIGVRCSRHPTNEEIQTEYARLRRRLGTRSIEELIDLPPLTDPDWQATIGVLATAMPPVLWTDPNLSCLLACRFVNLTLQHGNAEASCFAYIWLATLLGPHFGDYRTAYRLGKLAYDLAQRQSLNRFKARVYLCFAIFVNPWSRHLATSRGLIRRVFETANQIGDIPFAVYSCNNLVTNLLACGNPLSEAQAEADRGLEFAHKTRYTQLTYALTSQRQLILQLRGLTPTFASFSDAAFDESRFERHMGQNRLLALTACWYWVRKLQSRFYAGDYESAVQAAEKAERLLWASRSFFEIAEYHFFGALARVQLLGTVAPEARGTHHDALTTHHRQLAAWTEHCPENFEDRATLIAAEIARVEGRDIDAIADYEHAARAAREHGFVQNEALANELAARFFLARGFSTAAKGPLEAAHTAYAMWGAHGKVKQLEEQFPQLRAHVVCAERRYPQLCAGAFQGKGQLDLLSVAKASQAISEQIVLSELIDTLMRIMIESAGAQTACLLLARGGTLALAAEARANATNVDVRLHEDTAFPESTVPASVVNYVQRSRAPVLLGDAAEPNPFAADPYFALRRPKSVLCLPIVRQAALVGLLYLENDLFPYAFTPERVTVLELLASQVAISIGSARLYADLQQENQERRRAQDALREQEARVRRLVESNIIGILFWKLDGNISAANDAWLQMIGYTRDDLRSGKINWVNLIPKEYRDSDARVLQELRRSGACAPFEREYIHKDGHLVPVLIGTAPFEDSTEAGVAFVLDLSERKQAEADRQARQIAEAANRAKSAFLTSVSHELRTPLNAILGYTQILRQDPALGDRQRERVTVIQHSGEHLLQLIDDILDLAKIEAGKLDLNPVEFVLPGFLQVISETVVVKAEQKGVTFLCDAARDLPDRVWADQKRLRQVLLNLLGNAIKFTDKGMVRLEVCIPAPGRLHFAVHDTGIGIPADQLEQIFEPFEQLGERQRRSGGTGLGLPISRQFVQLMGGDLHVRSELGVGSTFWFELAVPVLELHTATRELPQLMPETELAAALPAPPSLALARLHHLALEGSMRDLAKEASRIASLDPRYLPFTDKLQALAKGYQSQAILRLIESSRGT